MRTRHRTLLAAILVELVVLVISASAVGAGEVSNSPCFWRPIEIQGAQLKGLRQTPIKQLEILTVRENALVPVAFEIDEVLPDGQLALAQGPGRHADDMPDIFDDDDRLILMFSDLGTTPADRLNLPPGAETIRVENPVCGAPRFAYVAATPRPRRSSADYVSCRAGCTIIESEHYRQGYTRGIPTDAAFHAHRGDEAPNLIDRFKVRVHAKILFRLFDFHLTEEDLNNHLIAWHDGPLRVVWRVKSSVYLGFGIRSPRVISEQYFYRDFIRNPYHVYLPWVPRAFFDQIRVRTDLDFLHPAGYRPRWSTGTGKVGERSSHTGRKRAWMALENPQWLLLQVLAFNTDTQKIDAEPYFNRSKHPDPPERVPGENPGVGYRLSGFENLAPGDHEFDSYLFVAPAGQSSPETLVKELFSQFVITVSP